MKSIGNFRVAPARWFYERFTGGFRWRSVVSSINAGPRRDDSAAAVIYFGPTIEGEKVIDPTISMIVRTTRNLKSKL